MDVLGGRVVWMTSGQQGPMRGEVAYAASKAALAGLTQTVADELIEQGVLLDTVNPGPVNTGYPETESSDRDEAAIEKGSGASRLHRMGEPDDPAQLIAWLSSDDGRWMAGQLLSTEGGFRRWLSAPGANARRTRTPATDPGRARARICLDTYMRKDAYSTA